MLSIKIYKKSTTLGQFAHESSTKPKKNNTLAAVLFFPSIDSKDSIIKNYPLRSIGMNGKVYYFFLFLQRRVCRYARYAFFRLRLSLSGQSKKLEALKDSHKGERCFVLGNGPSLTYDALERLKDEQTFGCNSLCLAFEKLGFSTTWFCFQSSGVYRKHKDIIDSLAPGQVIYARNCFPLGTKGLSPLWENAIPYSVLPHINYMKEKTKRFSTDPHKTVYDGYTIVYSMLQLAVYMGFRKIYILGVDCDYTHGKNSNHFVGSETENVRELETKYAGINMNQAFETARKYADGNGIEIYNCNPGGNLQVFERKSLDEALKG